MIPFPDKKYNIILADPPWSYWAWNEESQTGKGKASTHYTTMTMTALYELPVSTLAADDCVLFCWVTAPLMQEGLNLIKAWGFEYKTIGFTWIKSYSNGKMVLSLGHWTRSNTELCLLATKGSMHRISAAISQVVNFPRQEHSEKPSEVRERIVRLLGDLPRIELFARQKAYGWDAWGNEVEDLPTLEQFTF